MKKEENRPVVSFCIGTYNRCEYVLKHIRELLASENEKFDIIVVDNASTDATWEQLQKIRDRRVQIYRNEETVDYMTNWYLALEKADGWFAFHLNDRDRIHTPQLDGFIEYLEKHEEYHGGVCKHLPQEEEGKEYGTVEEAVMNLPYFSLHTTGHVFRVESYQEIKDRKELFQNRENGYHPHDLILGRLSSKGKLFIYTREIWKMATREFYKKNPSWLADRSKSYWFEPTERIKEMLSSIEEMEKLPIGEEVRKEKKEQIIKTYLQLCTVSYYYVLEDEAEAAHYHIPVRKISLSEKRRLIKETLRQFDEIAMLKPEFSYRKMKRWTYHNVIIHEAARRTAKYKDSFLRKMIGNLRRRKAGKEHINLR